MQASSLNSELEAILLLDSEFELDTNGTVTEVKTDLMSDHGLTILCDILLDGEPIAYSIRIDGILVEYSASPSPYSLYLNMEYSHALGYNYAEYFCITSEGVIYLHQNGEVDIEATEYQRNVNENIIAPLNVTIPGIVHNLQGSKNCIAAALSNVLWYWGGKGYSALRPASWQTLLNTIHSNFENSGGLLANSKVQAVVEGYARSRQSNYRVGGYVYWNPSTSQVVTEINAGRPCLVGFKKGSVYSDTAGHMTMCYGYYSVGTDFYVRLADGWKSSQVMRIWTSYNDCVKSVRPYLYTGGREISSIGGESVD